jgi:hypothetical protein
MKKKFIFWAALIVSVLLNVFLTTTSRRQRTTDVTIDTIVVMDTVRIVEPIYIKETIVRYDTVFFPMYKELESTSNLTSNLSQDSAKVVIPITQRVYEDSTYKAWVSGYDPRLDSLHLYRKEVYYPVMIKQSVKPKVVVSVGVYGGFGVKGADYGLGISVGVPILSWYD